MAGDIINGYQLGDCIGKGAFGTVYRGLNMETGVAVAVKQIKLVNLTKISIDVMMQEIDLLKKLNHQNIVKYMGFVKTNSYMNIILEYCENGSLQSIYKRFGKFPENLTGVYVAQVLDGLIYLHEQGVIHRDIKGANILSTKEGLVKLADFGVATIANDDNSVVGSPYWMAPEVIELTGATTTSDIWSVGCTVIELMEGNPPYHFLDPMAALFRIVQDDHPPLPQGASQSVNDFLLQCFQKDNNLRVSAKKLLKHPWIHNARTKEVKRKEDQITFDEDLKIVQEWNEALKRNISPQNTTDNLKSRLSPTYTQITIKGPEPSNQGMLEFTSNSPNNNHRLKSRAIQLSSIQPEEEEDNWDDDFDISGSDININKIKKEEKPGRKTKLSPSEGNSINSENELMGKINSLKLNPYTSNNYQEHYERGVSDPLTRYVENEEDNYDSLFGTAVILDNPYTRQLFAKHAPLSAPTSTTHVHSNHLRSNSPSSATVLSHLAIDDEEEDPFQSLEEGLEQTDLQANILRDKFARIITECKQLIKLLHPDQDESTLLDTCLKLEFLLVENPQMKYKFFNYHGILPILEMLEVCDSKDLLASLLRIINLIVYNNLEIQENLCLVGGIPVIIGLASKRYSVDIRLEVAYFIRQLCHTSTFTLQMFISCRGLKILVDFITEDYSEQRDFTWIAINGIASVFELQTPTPKQDFCRLFTKSGLLEPLSNILTLTLNSRDASVSRYTSKIVNLLLLFSQADSYVKESMGTSITLMSCLLREIRRLPINLAIVLLKCIRNLSMNPNTLDTLERANAIPILTDFLTPRNEFGVSEICNHVLNTMYNMCRINKRRQEIAAQAGLIPHLQQIVAINSPLKHVALPVLCDMAHAGKICRRILWKNNGLQFYLGLLRDPNWQTNGLEAILVWLQEDPREVEQVLVQSVYLDILIRTFVYSRNNIVFEGLIGPLPKIIRLSPKLALAITRKSKFNNKLIEKLKSHPKALVRLSLLKILKSLLDHAQFSTNGTGSSRYSTSHGGYAKPGYPERNRAQLLNCRYDITDTIQELAAKDPAVLVREMAKELLSQL